MTQVERLYKQLECIKEIDKIKFIFRQTKLINSDRRENDAEHSWHLAMMAMVLVEHTNFEVDLLRVMKMVLIHDIVEIDAGDVFFYDKTQSHDNRQEEYDAAVRIFGILPNDQAEELKNLWLEFEARETNDAKFASVLDRLEPMLQNASNKGGTWQEHPDITHSDVLASKLIMKEAATPLWNYAKQVLKESVELGILSPDQE